MDFPRILFKKKHLCSAPIVYLGDIIWEVGREDTRGVGHLEILPKLNEQNIVDNCMKLKAWIILRNLQSIMCKIPS